MCVSILYYFCLVLTYPFLRPGGPGPHSVESIQPEGRETVSASTGHMQILVVTVTVFLHFVIVAEYLTEVNSVPIYTGTLFLVFVAAVYEILLTVLCIFNVVVHHFLHCRFFILMLLYLAGR